MSYHLISKGRFHQGADCYPNEARGRQCVPCCLIFFLIVNNCKNPKDICEEDVHTILLCGSNLYCAIKSSGGVADDGFIDPDFPPIMVTYKGQKVYIVHKATYSGLVGHIIIENDQSFSLETAIIDATKLCKFFIAVFSGVSVGIYFSENCFYVFDSHSRNENGLSTVDGTAVVGVMQSLDDLCIYLRNLVKSFDQNVDTVQFDFHSYTVVKFFKKPYRVGFEIFDIFPGYKILHTRKRKNTETENCPNTKTIMVGKSLAECVDDRNVPGFQHDIISRFHKLVSTGPDFVCCCCTQTFFQHNMKCVNDIPPDKVFLMKKYLTSIKSVNDCMWLCKGCLFSLQKGNTSKFWLHNGLEFPAKPPELQLTNLEERLVSPRLAFMQLREMPRGGQLNIRGNVVNVPADVSSTVKMLPRLVSEDGTIMLKLKRKISYKHHIAFENIRPNKVFTAAKWLLNNSSLFKNEGIVLNESWLSIPQELPSVDITDIENEDCIEDTAMEENNDKWTEDENFNERFTGNLDTCLQAADFREMNQILSVAPAEKNSPISLFVDIHSEVLAFPTIFCGRPRVENSKRIVPLHFSDICKWELRNIDRRVANSIPNIFFKLKRLQIKQVKDKVSLAVRKNRTNGRVITAGELLTPGFVERLTLQNDGYRVLRNLRGSPPYWEQAKRDVFAMIRQIGIPTWFCSFSAAETKWVPLLQSLSKLASGTCPSTEDCNMFSWQEKCKLIKDDPVTCARYFAFRVQTFLNEVLKHKSLPIGKIIDYFYRIEFQQRGSPHIHMVAWVENAPVHGRDPDSEITTFIDKYVSCARDDTIPELINYQTHRHASTCRKKGKDICRFQFPIMPMPETVILYPLIGEDSDRYATDVKKIESMLNDLHKNGEDLTFEQFLKMLDIDFSYYMKVISSTLVRPKVFLKRTVRESRINSYNTVLLKSWLANMDLQYVLDAYSCVSYIVSYISKGQRGLSNLLQDACSEALRNESDIRQQVRQIGNQFLSSVEIGAQEAVFLALQMPLRKSTRTVVFVDTNKPEERTSLIKPWSQLKNLPKNSKDIEMDNTLKRYKRRPKSMEMLCYADFVSWYDMCTHKKQNKSLHDVDLSQELPETEYDLDQDDNIEIDETIGCGEVVKFPCRTQMRKRSRQKIIYSYIAPLKSDRLEHWRQKLMLYTNWRDEKDLLNGFANYEESFDFNYEKVRLNSAAYEKCAVDAELLEVSGNESVVTSLSSESQHQDEIDVAAGSSKAEDYGCFDPGVASNVLGNYDLGEDICLNTRTISEELPHHEISNDEYFEQVRSLNTEQKNIFYHILHKVKTKRLPFYTFLSGGAGVGKSVVVRCVYQGLLKFLNHQREEEPDATKILMCAPTGKAAHHVGGATIHSAFCVPINQGFHFKPLDMQQLNTMRARYRSLRIVIIDEISMVGRSMMNFINLRLQEITGCTKAFGNVSILAVGDLYQLKPVADAWIFSQVYNLGQLTALGPNLWVQLFDFYELQVVMRQRDDLVFAELLNRLREGLHTEDDISILESRIVENGTEAGMKHLPHLFCTRKDVFSHNTIVLEEMASSDLVTIDALDDVSGDISQSLRDVIMTKIPDDSKLTMGLQKHLTLGIGLPAEICLNVDTEDGLTNGASCLVKKFDFRVENSKRCSIIWVLFEDETVGKKWRTRYRHLYRNGIPPGWTPILETSRRFNFRYYKSYLVVRRQFPLYLSAGKTIHKAQGSTLQESVMHFGSRKTDHIHYVGLSRVTSLSGVHIKELNASKISVSSEVEAEMYRLRTERSLSCVQNGIESFSTSACRVLFHNSRSLKKHFDNFKAENYLTSFDVIGLVETRLWGHLNQRYHLNDFNAVFAEANNSAHGMAVYYRRSSNVEFKFLVSATVSQIEYMLVGVEQEVVIGFVYCPPKCATVANLLKFLSTVTAYVAAYIKSAHKKLVLLGDFNIDNDANQNVFLDTFQLRQLVTTVTTDYGSCLDHIYTNVLNTKIEGCGTLESYYSDHKPVYIAFNM